MTESAIIIEIHTNDRWVEIGRLRPCERPGTMTDLHGGAKTLILFGWFLRARDEHDAPVLRPLVTRVTTQLDVAVGQLRGIAPEDATLLADLTDGPHERTVLSEGAIPVRWTVVET